MAKKETQAEQILKHLAKYGSINPLEAFNEYGCMRLGARIWDLRYLGFKIDTINEQSKNRNGVKVTYAKYVWKDDRDVSLLLNEQMRLRDL